MKAMVLRKITDLANNTSPLELVDLPIPVHRENEVLVKVSACGVCHTELDEIEGGRRLRSSDHPWSSDRGPCRGRGSKAARFKDDERVGIAWIHSACGNAHSA